MFRKFITDQFCESNFTLPTCFMKVKVKQSLGQSVSSMFRRHWGGLEDVRKRLRQLTLPRRVLVIVLCSLVALYFLISSIFSSENSSVTNPCILERTREWKELEESALASTSPHLPVFVGNGY